MIKFEAELTKRQWSSNMEYLLICAPCGVFYSDSHGTNIHGILWNPSHTSLHTGQYHSYYMSHNDSFVSSSTSIGLYSFFMLTKTEPEYDQAEQRFKLLYTHKFIRDNPNFDLDEFNAKMRKLTELNENLNRLRDPLRVQLPIRQIRQHQTLDLY